jgi:DNA polymerase-3 subunit gamma/tau
MNDEPQLITGEPDQPGKESGSYRVLARKYRPENFHDLIGQDAMVRTLTNAFDSGRLAHAFILTGVRGVGKTTTARIIARALNCIGPDGNGGPTIDPCGECDKCTAISEDRLVDVMEMDAASRTGVDDVRELIEGVRYKPVAARYKVYIIDEVHMLSRNAFNALLKTLEEPPEHVKFIFATTEIRKVPVTVLSRCQRFDLRRVDVETLSKHFIGIAEKEDVKISAPAIALIARAADGSVRDGQSLLDQAIATGASDGGELTDVDVRDILGLADRERSFDLLEQVMAGDVATALDTLTEDYTNGADPLIVLQDLLDVVHWLTRVKVTPALADDPSNAESDRVRGKDLSTRLSMAALSRAWQMLLKGLREAQSAPMPIQAVEMILIRLAYLSDLPSPADAVQTLQDGGSAQPTSSGPAPGGGNGGGARAMAGVQVQAAAQTVAAEPQAIAKPRPASFEEVVALADQMNERTLRVDLVNNVHLVAFEPGKIGIRLTENAAPNLADRLRKFLNDQTGRNWSVLITQEAGEQTLRQQEDAEKQARRAEVAKHPMMQAMQDVFPGAEVEDIRTIGGSPEDEEAPPADDEEGETDT